MGKGAVVVRLAPVVFTKPHGIHIHPPANSAPWYADGTNDPVTPATVANTVCQITIIASDRITCTLPENTHAHSDSPAVLYTEAARSFCVTLPAKTPMHISEIGSFEDLLKTYCTGADQALIDEAAAMARVAKNPLQVAAAVVQTIGPIRAEDRSELAYLACTHSAALQRHGPGAADITSQVMSDRLKIWCTPLQLATPTCVEVILTFTPKESYVQQDGRQDDDLADVAELVEQLMKPVKVSDGEEILPDEDDDTSRDTSGQMQPSQSWGTQGDEEMMLPDE
jgi:hypothetical protein